MEWLTLVAARRNLRQKNLEFKASLGYLRRHYQEKIRKLGVVWCVLVIPARGGGGRNRSNLEKQKRKNKNGRR